MLFCARLTKRFIKGLSFLKVHYHTRIEIVIQREKKLKKMEKEGPDALEVATEAYEAREA